ncbi:YegP family protein [Actinoplanes sp. CA-030573]|uniref:YegP family protein n=1 Tax=Actinoplanes sp. CA-030573 TaxID=3239898 RepID=UPI003D8A8EB7
MKFVVKKSSNGEFRFNLVASNGQVVATSEGYKQKASAMNTIASIQKSAGGATVDDQTNA